MQLHYQHPLPLLPKLAILTSRFPYPLEKGDKLRLYHQMVQLQAHFDITLIALSDHQPTVAHMQAVQDHCVKVEVLLMSRWRRALALLGAMFTGLPLQVAYHTQAPLRARVASIIAEVGPDAIYCHLARMAEYVPPSGCVRVIDYMDAFSVGMQRRSTVAPLLRKSIYRMEAARMSAYEREILPRFDHHTIISDQDKRLLGIDQLHVISNGIDQAFFAVAPQTETAVAYDIVFVGNMGYLPNVAAAEYLVREINRAGKYKILLAGARPGPRVKQLASEDVTVSGWVDDIRDAYRAASLFVAPLYNGTGQQNKILEAMALGVPVVTTTEVNEAIGAVPNKEIMTADTVKAFTVTIDLLLQQESLRRELAIAARDMVMERYGWAEQTQILLKLLHS